MYPASGYHTEDVATDAALRRKDVGVVALADLFDDRLSHCAEQVAKLGINIPREARFTGFHAYEQLLAMPDVNYVILATPPHFRPMHLKAAIEAGKNVFMEKPAAVDVPGVKMVIEAGELAKQKQLGIGAGTHRRRMRRYQEAIKRIHDGAIGEILSARCYWNGAEIWVIDRQPGWSDLEWQIRNWNYLTWLSGDHYVEQHVHSLDIMNWMLGRTRRRPFPASAVAKSAPRSDLATSTTILPWNMSTPTAHVCIAKPAKSTVAIFLSAKPLWGLKARAIATTSSSRGRPALGTSRARTSTLTTRNIWILLPAFAAGRPINEAQNVAESTMTAIIGTRQPIVARP